MKILIISPGYQPVTKKIGAIEKLIEYYLDYNENVKDDISIYTVKLSNELIDNKEYKYTKYKIIDKTNFLFKIEDLFYRVINRLFKKNIPNAYIRNVVRELKKEKEENSYDYIIFENNQYNLPYFKNKINTKSKIILHLHNDYLNKDTKNHSEIIHSCNEIWAVSNFIKARIEEVNSRNVPVKVLYNGFDLTSFNKKMSNISINKLKDQLKVTDKFIFLYTGRIIPEKGVKELIHAYNTVHEKNKETALIIVGGSKNINKVSNYQKELYDLAKKNPSIIFTGYINYEEIYKYYNIADVQVVPSICNEAFGLVLLESISANNRIIATNIGGIPEVLGDEAEYVSKDNIIDDLIIKMNEAINLPKKEKNYERIINKFSLENYCRNFENLLKEVDKNDIK